MKTISKNRIKTAVYKRVSPLTAHLYTDDNWQGVSGVLDAIREALASLSDSLSLGVSVIDGGYHTSNDGMAHYKTYTLAVTDDNGKQIVGGHLNAHGAGYESDPFAKYDMSVVLW